MAGSFSLNEVSTNVLSSLHPNPATTRLSAPDAPGLSIRSLPPIALWSSDDPRRIHISPGRVPSRSDELWLVISIQLRSSTTPAGDVASAAGGRAAHTEAANDASDATYPDAAGATEGSYVHGIHPELCKGDDTVCA